MVDTLKNQCWEIESLRIVDTNPEGQLPMKFKQNEKMSFNAHYYEVRLPWKEDCMPQSNNYGMCMRGMNYGHYIGT